MTAAERVCARKSNYFLVVEAHSVKDFPEVAGTLCSVWQAPLDVMLQNLRIVDIVGSSAFPWDGWPTCHLNSDGASQCPEVGVGDPWVRFFDRLEENACMLEAGIGGVAAFMLVAHAGAVGATGVGVGVIGAGGVPG